MKVVNSYSSKVFTLLLILSLLIPVIAPLQETQAGSVSGLTVHFKKPADWGAPQLYYYDAQPGTVTPVQWSTAPMMELESGGWYKYTISDATSATVIFKDSSGRQMPGASQPGFSRTYEGWFDGTTGTWYDTDPTASPTDTEPPTVPANITAQQVTSTSVKLSWTDASDNFGVAGYEVKQNNQTIGDTSSNYFIVSSLSPATTYFFTVSSIDYASNKSAESQAVSVTTLQSGGGLKIHFKRPANWGTPQLYYYEPSPASVPAVNWSDAPDMSYEQGDWYQYTIEGATRARVIFKDRNGNQMPGASQPGFEVSSTETWYDGSSWTTSNPDAPDTEVPTTPTNLSISNLRKSSLTLNWSPSVDNRAIGGYVILRNGSYWTSTTGPGVSYDMNYLTPGMIHSFTVVAVDMSGNYSQESTPVTVQVPIFDVGDYIRYGSYAGERIVWRVINIDGAGNPLLLADQILSLKAFDAAGEKYELPIRSAGGSNYYPESTLRQWLNSSKNKTREDAISWKNNSPSSANLYDGHNPYDSEPGFLSSVNFTEDELDLILPYTQKVILNELDQDFAEGGSAPHQYEFTMSDSLKNYESTAYARNVTDLVFLPSLKQIKNYVYDRGWDVTATPTAYAVESSTYSSSDGPYTTSPWSYWLNTAAGLNFNADLARIISRDGIASLNGAYYGFMGVRPAVQLRSNDVEFISGIGTKETPYEIDRGSDTEAPTAPTNMTISEISADSLKLRWDASTDNVAVTGYQIYRNETLIATVSEFTLEYQVTGLAPGSYDLYYIKAMDAAGNVSDQSNYLYGRTASPPFSIYLTNFTVDENVPGAYIGQLITYDIDYDLEDTFTYELVDYEGNPYDNASFFIEGSQLYSNETFDYETRYYYFIRVRVTDRFGLSYEQFMYVYVNDVNEVAPNFELTPSSIDENRGEYQVVGWFTVSDYSQTPGYYFSLVNGDGDIDNESFMISNWDLIAKPNFNFEEKSSYSIRVQISNGSLTFEKSMIIQVNNVNEAPVAEESSIDVIEDNSATGEFKATDVDGSPLQYYIVSLPYKGVIDLEYNTGKFTYTPYPNATGEDSLVFQVWDGELVSNYVTVPINIQAENDTPTYISLSNYSIPENNDIGAVLSNLSAYDPDSDVLTFSLPEVSGSDNALFSINGDLLTANTVFNFEERNLYNLYLQVSDGVSSSSEWVYIYVSNVNEAPTGLLLSQMDIAENNELNAPIGKITVLDPDPLYTGDNCYFKGYNCGTFAEYSYRNESYNDGFNDGFNDGYPTNPTFPSDNWSLSIVEDYDFDSFVLEGNELRAAKSFDYEAKEEYQVKIQVDDGGLLYSELFTIKVTDVNEPPVKLTISNDSIAENNEVDTVIGTLTTTDPDRITNPSYSIVEDGTSDGQNFYIDGDVLKAKSTFDYEVYNLYQFKISVTDEHVFTDYVTVYVLNVNEAPEAEELTLEVTEDSSVEGDFVASDPDGDGLTYFVPVQPKKGDIQFDNQTGEFTYTPYANETGEDSFVYKAWDGQLASNYVTVPITIAAVNDAPADIQLSNIGIFENSGESVSVGDFSAEDADLDDFLSYSLVDGEGSIDNASFDIQEQTLIAMQSFDYEYKSLYYIRVEVSDGSLAFEKIFPILVINVNEAPGFITLDQNKMDENNQVDDVIGNLYSVDPDGDELMFTLPDVAGSDNGHFTISDGKLLAGETFDYEAKSSYAIQVKVSDGEFSYTEYFDIIVQNVNEAPTDISLSNSSVAENNSEDTVVGSLLVTDPDGPVDLKEEDLEDWEASLIEEGDHDYFELEDFELLVKKSLNYEQKSSYQVTIEISDGDLTYSEQLTITVSDVNEAPKDIALSNSNISENNVANATVGTLSATDPDAGSTLTFGLVDGEGATDNSSFNINGTSLRANISFNYESKSSYSVRVQVSDGSLVYSKAITINVTNVNEAPTDIILSASTIAENAGANAEVATLSTTDPDVGGSYTYSLVSGTGATDNASFSISGSKLIANSSFNFESKSSYSVRIQVTDVNLTYTKPFTITVTNVNEEPTDIVLSSNTVAENGPSNATIGTFSANDPDASSSLSFSLVSGAGDSDNSKFTTFGTNGATLRAAQSFDYESTPSLSIRVQVSDGSLTYAKLFSVTVTNVNEAPTDILLSNNTVDENSPANTLVGTLTATDPDASSTFTFTTVSGTGDIDNRAFSIAGNQLRTSSNYDFETKSSYSIRVQVSDGSLTFAKPLAILITNVNEAATNLSLSNTTISENAGKDAVVGTVTVTDPDTTNSHSFVVYDANSVVSEDFYVDSGKLKAKKSFDFETVTSYSIRIEVIDGTFTYGKAFTISVTDIIENFPPTGIELSNNIVDENAGEDAIVGTLSAIDPDTDDTFMYKLVDGEDKNDNELFYILDSTLYVVSSLDYEAASVYKINIRVSDGSSIFESEFDILVNDINEAPYGLTMSNTSIDENSPQLSIIGYPKAEDPETQRTLLYSIVEDEAYPDGTQFALVEDLLVNLTDLDYESKSEYVILIRASDGEMSVDQPVTITINDVNDKPTSILLSKSIITENVEANTVIGTLGAVDQDATGTYEFSIEDEESVGDIFAIEDNQLKILISPDYETEDKYTIRVRVTDGEYSFETDITIDVFNVNEGPSNLSLSNQSIAEAAGSNEVVGVLSADSEDPSQVLTYSLVEGEGDTDNESFNISGSTLRANSSLDFEQKAEYSVRIRVSDGVMSVEEVFTITVTSVSEAPYSIELTNNTVDENAWIGYHIGRFSVQDSDIDDSATVSLASGEGDTDNDLFYIQGDTLRTAIDLDYATGKLYSIRVRATDSTGLFYEQPFEVNITRSNATLNPSNKVVTIFFQERIVNVYPIKQANEIKKHIFITNDANSDEPTYNPLGPDDSVRISGNKLIVTFSNTITGYYNRIKITSGGLKDISGNMMVEQVTSPLVVDDIGPKLLKVTVAKNKKKIEAFFNERIFNASTALTPTEKDAALKSSISITQNSDATEPLYSPLGSRDRVLVLGRKMEINLSQALTGTNNKLKITAGALRDVLKNNALDIESQNMLIDTSGPIFNKISLSPTNKMIRFTFNEPALIAVSGKLSVKMAALKAGIMLTSEGNEPNPTYTPLSEADIVEVVEGKLNIKLAAPLVGSFNRVRINSNLFKDEIGNKNVELLSSMIVADQTAPVVKNVSVPFIRENLVAIIQMNESVASAITEGNSKEKKEAFQAAVTISTNGDAENPVYVPLRSTDKVTVGGNKITITFSRKLVKNIKYRVRIQPDVLKDLTGNKSAEIITSIFGVDTSGPKLR